MSNSAPTYESRNGADRGPSRATWPPAWLTPAPAIEPEVAPEPAIEPPPITEPLPIEPLTGWSSWIEDRPDGTWMVTQRDGERVAPWEEGMPWAAWTDRPAKKL